MTVKNYALNAAAQTQATAQHWDNPAPESSVLEQMRGKICAETSRIIDTAALLESVANRAFGVYPDTYGSESKESAVVQSSAAEEIWVELTRLENATTRLNNAAQRFSNLA